MRVGWKPKSDDPRIASVRFRCLTPLAELRAEGKPIELYADDTAYDAVIFSKLYGAKDQELAIKLGEQGCRTILDLSDNHFYNPYNLPLYEAASRDLRLMAGIVDQVVCCSAHLADIVAQEAPLHSAPLVVGDAVENFDLPVAQRAPDEPFRFLWFGSHGSPNAPAGMQDLLRVREHLAAAAQARACELMVVSNNRAAFDELSAELEVPMRYREWEHAAFAEELVRSDVVLVPVSANPFTLCKSNNRVATALWYGAPVLADRIPAYDELAPYVVLDDWASGFRAALDGDRRLQQRTLAGHDYVRRRFNSAAIAKSWWDAIEITFARTGADDALS